MTLSVPEKFIYITYTVAAFMMIKKQSTDENTYRVFKLTASLRVIKLISVTTEQGEGLI